MSLHCSRGRWQAGVALAAPTVAEARCGRRHAAKSFVGGAVGCQGGLARCYEEVSAWPGAAERAKTRGASVSARARFVQYACSGRVQCTHGRCSTQCRGVLQVTGEVGKQ